MKGRERMKTLIIFVLILMSTSVYSKELKVTLLRVVPLKYSKNKFKLQYTISFPMELKGDYVEIIKNNPKFLKEKDKRNLLS